MVAPQQYGLPSGIPAATPAFPTLPGSAYKGNTPAAPVIPGMPYVGQPSEKLDAMRQINDATAQAKQSVNAAQNMVPVTLANGIRMNVPSGEANALGIQGLPMQSGKPAIDANKLLGTPITLPGTPEHYKDVTTRILAEQATVASKLLPYKQSRPSTRKEP